MIEYISILIMHETYSSLAMTTHFTANCVAGFKMAICLQNKQNEVFIHPSYMNAVEFITEHFVAKVLQGFKSS